MSNLKSQLFNERGPVKIPDADFQKYLAYPADFNMEHAIDEAFLNPITDPNLRHLIIRDIFRQFGDRKHACFNLGADFSSVLNFLDEGNCASDYNFYYFLSKSPELRQWFVEENLYNIENGILLPGSDEDRTILGELIEFLIVLGYKFGENIDIDYLWAIHPLNTFNLNRIKQAWLELRFCARGICPQITDRTNIPSHFHREVWIRLRKNLSVCLEPNLASLRQHSRVYDDRHPHYNPALRHLAAPPDDFPELLTRFCIEIVHNPRITEDGIRFLEEELPDNIQYIPLTCLPSLLPKIADRDLAYLCLRRHVRPTTAAALQTLDHNFLYWALGLSCSMPNGNHETERILIAACTSKNSTS